MFQLCDEKDLASIFAKCQALFYKTPFYNLQQAFFIPSPPQAPCSLPITFKFSCENPKYEELYPVIIALYHLCASFCLIIDISPSHIDFYIHVRSLPNSLDAACILNQLFPFKLEQVSSDVLNIDDLKAITSITCIPQDKDFSPSLLTDFLSRTKDNRFKLFFLATPLDPHDYYHASHQVAELCTMLTPLKSLERFHHHHHTDSCSTTCTNNTNESKNTGYTNTQTATDVANTSNTCTQTLSFNTVQPKLLNATQNNNGSLTNGSSDTHTDSSTTSNSNQCNESHTLTKTNGLTLLDIDTSKYTIENKQAISLLTQGLKVLTYYEETLKEPLYTFNTFVGSCNLATNLIATSCFLNLVPITSLYSPFVNSWAETYKPFYRIQQELLCLNPLVFNSTPKDCLTSTLGLPVSLPRLTSFLTAFMQNKKADSP